MESHGGSFEIEKQGDQCVCRLFIPAAPAEEPAGVLPEGSNGKAAKAVPKGSNDESALFSSPEATPEGLNGEAASTPVPSSEAISESSNEKTAE